MDRALYLIAYEFNDEREDAILNLKTAVGMSGAEIWDICDSVCLVRSHRNATDLAREIVSHLNNPDDKLLVAQVSMSNIAFEGHMEEQVKRILRPLSVPRPS